MSEPIKVFYKIYQTGQCGIIEIEKTATLGEYKKKLKEKFENEHGVELDISAVCFTGEAFNEQNTDNYYNNNCKDNIQPFENIDVNKLSYLSYENMMIYTNAINKKKESIAVTFEETNENPPSKPLIAIKEKIKSTVKEIKKEDYTQVKISLIEKLPIEKISQINEKSITSSTKFFKEKNPSKNIIMQIRSKPHINRRQNSEDTNPEMVITLNNK